MRNSSLFLSSGNAYVHASYFAFYILNVYTKIYANHVKANDEQQIVAFQKFLERV